MDEPAACEIVCWRYDPPYDIYNLDDAPESIQYALDPRNRFYVMRNESRGAIGFCSFGQDGQVPGGNYAEAALDIGMGVRPDLTGQGRGAVFAASVLHFARREFQPTAFRVTIAAFNQRAQRVWQKLGFHEIEQFVHIESGREFMVLIRESTSQRICESTI
jgi:RimJ/RimL family protein N-acetyltransferase